jgi:hypothetical protein
MDEKQIQQVVAEVLKRLVQHMGATGARGDVVVVFTGATAGFTEAIQQVRSLVVRGFCPRLVFSHSAELLYGSAVWKELDGFPQVAPFDDSHWLTSLKEAKAVVVPVLSVDTISKLSLLVADNLASNLVLHALFMGKPLILAQNGVDPSDKGRIVRHFPNCSPVVAAAIRERIEVVRSYGCEVVDVTCLTGALEAALRQKAREAKTNGHGNGATKLTSFVPKGKIITAADVLQARQSGALIRLRPSAVVTPLARELAQKHGVGIVTEV